MKNNWKTKDLTKMGLFIALLAISAQITVPFGPIPFTLQTVIINLIGLLLNPMQAFVTILSYLLLGSFGLPIFSGATGGIGKLLGPTGGFLIGFLLAAPFVSFVFHKLSRSLLSAGLCLVLLGMPVIYGLGTLYMMVLTGMSLSQTLTVAVFPFLLPELFKLLLSFLLFVPLRRVFFSFEK